MQLLGWTKLASGIALSITALSEFALYHALSIIACSEFAIYSALSITALCKNLHNALHYQEQLSACQPYSYFPTEKLAGVIKNRTQACFSGCAFLLLLLLLLLHSSLRFGSGYLQKRYGIMLFHQTTMQRIFGKTFLTSHKENQIFELYFLNNHFSNICSIIIFKIFNRMIYSADCTCRDDSVLKEYKQLSICAQTIPPGERLALWLLFM